MNWSEFEQLADFAKEIGAVYNRYSGRTYKVVKSEGQYAVKFDDDGSFFWLNSDTRKEAIEESRGYDAEGLFAPEPSKNS